MSDKTAGKKLDYKKTLLIGAGFMSTSIAWAIYDPYITRILESMLSASTRVTSWSNWLIQKFPRLLDFASAQGEDVGTALTGFTLVPLFIGLIMTFDNIFGVIFQPTFGKLSDNTHTRFGKRMPFILIGAPISAVLFALIPWSERTVSVPMLMTFVILFVMVMSMWRAPVVALMPDLTPHELRSEGNAIINLCGGIGGLIGMLAGSILVAIFGFNSDLHEEFPWVFLLGSIVMILGTLILFFFVKEPDNRVKVTGEVNKAADEAARKRAEKEAVKAEKARIKAIKLSRSERVSLVFMLFSLFFLFCGTNSITTFFSLFAKEVLNKSTADATKMMAIFAVCSMAAAIPAGKLGQKIGRKKTILIGLVMFTTVFVLYKITGSLAIIWVALVVGGAANMMITVNTLPLVLEIGGLDKVGTFTGYYYTATFSAQIAAPIIFGIVRMFSGTYNSLFVFSPTAFVLSLLCILFVKHGEAIPEDVIKEAQMADD